MAALSRLTKSWSGHGVRTWVCVLLFLRGLAPRAGVFWRASELRGTVVCPMARWSMTDAPAGLRDGSSWRVWRVTRARGQNAFAHVVSSSPVDHELSRPLSTTIYIYLYLYISLSLS
jgi:hypothetical protein